MHPDEFEARLRFWGRVYGPAPPSEWDEDSSHGSGALTGCLIDFLRVGIVSGAEPEHLTARGRESEGGAKPMKAHPQADEIDVLCCQLYREGRLAALVLRANYCMRGPRREKLPWVSGIYGAHVSRRQFGEALVAARGWMFLALQAKAA